MLGNHIVFLTLSTMCEIYKNRSLERFNNDILHNSISGKRSQEKHELEHMHIMR